MAWCCPARIRHTDQSVDERGTSFRGCGSDSAAPELTAERYTYIPSRPADKHPPSSESPYISYTSVWPSQYKPLGQSARRRGPLTVMRAHCSSRHQPRREYECSSKTRTPS